MNEEGGGRLLSFAARKSALLFVRGITVGGSFTLATAMVSRRLCPGTPSNVFEGSETFFTGEKTALIDARIFGFGFAAAALSFEIRNDAALVIRGAIAGAAVDATAIVSLRLWPGTLAKVFANASLDNGARGFDGVVLDTAIVTSPARNAAALVVRGAMSGATCVFGSGRARNMTLPFESRPWLPPPTVDGLVAAEAAYPSLESDAVRRTGFKMS